MYPPWWDSVDVDIIIWLSQYSVFIYGLLGDQENNPIQKQQNI